MPAIIELNNISKHFGDVVGVAQVDLSVEDGEFLTLLGPSGCGKSTLLRMIGGFEAPTTGTIRLAGSDVTHLPPQKRDVNMMFQDYALFPHMTVGKNIAYGLKMRGIPGEQARHKAAAALDLVGLPDKIDQFPHQLSGGQRQRIALARAVVREPKVLLLDEPLSALDAKLREQMQIELKHMHEKLGITFVMVTHDQTEALVMSDRIVVMEEGRIVQDGEPEDLYERPNSPYVANFIGTTNFLSARLVTSSGREVVVETSGSKLSIKGQPVASVNAPVMIGFRPEKVRLLPEGARTSKNTLAGKVSEHIYYGLGLRTVVEIGDGNRILVDELLPEGRKHSYTHKLGQPVRVSIEPHNIFLFDAGQ